jgi:hypothetical protein
MGGGESSTSLDGRTDTCQPRHCSHICLSGAVAAGDGRGTGSHIASVPLWGEWVLGPGKPGSGKNLCHIC